MVSPSGETTLLAPPPAVDPPDKASFVVADATRSVWLVNDPERPLGGRGAFGGQTMLIVGPRGDTKEIPVLGDDGSLWNLQGSQIGMSGLRTLTADGTHLLLGILAPGNTLPTRLVDVDLGAGTPHVVYEGANVEGFWAADDRTAIVFDSRGDASGPDTTLVAVDTETGAVTTLEHLPADVEFNAAG
jgi:hypothetical protein